MGCKDTGLVAAQFAGLITAVAVQRCHDLTGLPTQPFLIHSMPLKPPTVLILASGRGERFKASGGSVHKLQALLAGKPVLQHTLDAVRASGLPWHVEDAGHPGMGDSIAAAVRHTANAAGWLVFALRVFFATALLGAGLWAAGQYIDWIGLRAQPMVRVGVMAGCLMGAVALYFGALAATGLNLRKLMRR